VTLAQTVLTALSGPQGANIRSVPFEAPRRPNAALRASSLPPEARDALRLVRAEFSKVHPGVTPSVGTLRVFAARQLTRAKRREVARTLDLWDGLTDAELAEIEAEETSS
jgi:hypothetical protein